MLQKYYYFLRTAKECLTFAMEARKILCSNEKLFYYHYVVVKQLICISFTPIFLFVVSSSPALVYFCLLIERNSV